MDQPVRTFASVEEFRAWFNADIDGEDCVDNWRECWADDAKAVADYNEQVRTGCCGFSDRIAMINGREYWIGCNYGH